MPIFGGEYMADNFEDGVWRTVGGRRVFIRNGQDLASAMRESGKFHGQSQKKGGEVDFSDSLVKSTVFHGSPKEFEEFDPEQSIEGNKALWFSESEDYPEEMAAERGGGFIYEVKLNIQNPMEVDLPPGKFTDPVVERGYIEKAREGGYDAVIFTNKTASEYAQDTFYAVFDPSQVKILGKRKL